MRISGRIEALFHDMAKSSRYPIVVRVPFLFISSWVFQGTLQMDAAERAFKCSVDVILSILLIVAVSGFFSLWAAVILAVFVAHTVNWLVNGQVLVVVKNLGWSRCSQPDLEAFLDHVAAKACRSRSIQGVYSIGSHATGCLKNESDLDIRLLRREGILNGLRACALSSGLRTRALSRMIPLDILVADSISSKVITRIGETPIDLCGHLRDKAIELVEEPN
jgi:hypothetical protein